MMDETRVAQLHSLIEPILADHHMELVELNLRPQGGQQLVQVLVDKVGGVTIQHCARVNQRVGEALETAKLIEGSYTIEVSSPGLDRPLVSKRDFERALGENVDVDRQLETGRVQRLRGMVLAVQQEAIVLKTPSANITIPLSDVRVAK